MTVPAATLRLFTAIQQQDLNAVSRALAQGVSASAWGPNQTTPLCAAIMACPRDPEGQAKGMAIVQRLVDAHPYAVSDRSGNGVVPLDLALSRHRWDLARWLLDRGVRWTAASALTDYVGPMALDGEADLLARMVPDLGAHNLTVRLNVLNAMASRLANPNARRTDTATWTPVWDAWDRLGLPLGEHHPTMHGITGALAALAWQGHAVAVTVLLNHGRNPNGVNAEEAFTPLHLAAMRGHLPVVDALLNHGADAARQAGVSGDTPLSLAQRLTNAQQRAEVVARLEQVELRSTLDTPGISCLRARSRL